MDDGGTGGIIKRVREARGMSTTALATRAGCTTRHIELIEQGRRTPSLPMLRQIAKVLGVRSAVLLGEAPRDTHEPGRPQVLDIERAMYTYRTLPGPLLEPPSAEQIIARSTTARDVWFTSPMKYSQVMRLLPGLLRDAEALVLAAAASPEKQSAACHAAADVYMLARGVLKHLGRIDLAHLSADRAMHYAEQAGDPLLSGWAYWNLGQSMLADDMYDLAYEVARHALEQMERCGTDDEDQQMSIMGGLHLLAAVAAARQGNIDQARDHLSGPARQLATRVDESRPHPGLFFGSTNVGIHAVAVELENHDPETALRRADDVDLSRTMSVERRTSHLAQLARACEDVGDDAAVLVYLLRIERECPEELDRKQLLREMVGSLARRARPAWAPEVRYLAERHQILI